MYTNHPMLILLIFLLLLQYPYTLKAQEENVSDVQINGKLFLQLPPEDPPESMTWGRKGEPIESYLGITAYSNGDAPKGQRYYQCTELVHRFMREIWGIPTRLGLGMGHGVDLAKGMASFLNTPMISERAGNRAINLEYFENNRALHPPVVGSIVSMYFNSTRTGFGHVGIIRKIESRADGSLRGILFDQHGSIHIEVGISIKPDYVDFSKNGDGSWNGQVYSWRYQHHYPTKGWTNVVVQETL